MLHMSDTPWLTSYPPDVDWRAPITPRPMHTILEEAAKAFPNRPALEFLGRRTSYHQLAVLVNRVAAGFRKLGVKPGVKVGLLLPNCPQFVIAYYAALKAGGTVVNFSPLYSLPELEHQAKDSGTEILVTLNLNALYPKALVLLEAGILRHLVVSTLPEALPFPKSLLFPLCKKKEIARVAWDERHIRWASLVRCVEMAAGEVPVIRPEKDIALLQYTGGTTGTPKAAALTHANIYANVMQCGLWFPDALAGREKLLGVLPFFHVFAMTVAMNFGLLKGAEIILHLRFDLVDLLKDIHRKKPTLMPGVPTMFTAINHHPQLARYNLSSLKFCISGGAALPVEVKQNFEKLTGCTLIEGYGLTETSPVVCVNPLKGANKAGSIGLPLPQTIVKIEDMENRGSFLPPGGRGELCVGGPQVMQGYWNKPEETVQVIGADGLLRTGDVATMDNDGYVYIVDRLKEMIAAGGFKIYPRHVEEVIYQHEAVKEAAVIGVPDTYRGEAVKAFVVLKEGCALTEAGLKEFLKEHLGKHEIPRMVEFRESLPKTMVGKICKKDLKG